MPTDYDEGYVDEEYNEVYKRGLEDGRSEAEEKFREGNKRLPRLPRLLSVTLTRVDAVKFVDANGRALAIDGLSEYRDSATGTWNAEVILVPIE